MRTNLETLEERAQRIRNHLKTASKRKRFDIKDFSDAGISESCRMNHNQVVEGLNYLTDQKILRCKELKLNLSIPDSPEGKKVSDKIERELQVPLWFSDRGNIIFVGLVLMVILAFVSKGLNSFFPTEGKMISAYLSALLLGAWMVIILYLVFSSHVPFIHRFGRSRYLRGWLVLIVLIGGMGLSTWLVVKFFQEERDMQTIFGLISGLLGVGAPLTTIIFPLIRDKNVRDKLKDYLRDAWHMLIGNET